MNRIHSTLIAFVLGGAVTAGAYAAVHTVRLGQKAVASTIYTHAVAARQAKLVAWHRSLKAALAKRPPALPKLPHFAPVHAPATPVAAAPASPPVTYVQPPPVVAYKHAVTKTTSSGSGEHEDSGGENDSGGGDN